MNLDVEIMLPLRAAAFEIVQEEKDYSEAQAGWSNVEPHMPPSRGAS